MRPLAFLLLATVVAGLGCGGSEGAPATPDPDPDVVPSDDTGAPFSYVAHLPQGESQRAALCALDRDDRFRRWYCAGEAAPKIDGIASLVAGVGLDVSPFAQGGDRFAAITHSTALAPMGASVLNPRVIFMSPAGQQEFATMLFARGELVAELAMKDLAHDQINFYLVTYHLACWPRCSPADRYRPAADSGWKDVSVYAESDIHNTPLDCLRCHVPGGGSGKRILRMHELDVPWTHWMFGTTTGEALGRVFADSRPADETYAGIEIGRFVGGAAPDALEDLIRAQSEGDQPNRFDGDAINGENPAMTEPSSAWLELYLQALEGQTIDAPPHFAVSPFSPAKVSAAAEAYRRVASGAAPPGTLPSLTRGLWDEPALRYIGFKPGAGLDARGIVRHVCGPCHDGRFPGITRDNFRVADFPDGLSEEMRALVASRVGRARNDAALMPPVIAAELNPEEIQKVQAALGQP